MWATSSLWRPTGLDGGRRVGLFNKGEDIREDNPGFSFTKHGGFVKTSEQTTAYNCIAWAADDKTHWWWPFLAYWPDKAPRDLTIEAFVKAFSLLGYAICADTTLEEGYEKVAIFAVSGVPTHAARQIVKDKHKGRWTSKMGRNIDVAHNLMGATGPAYGKVAVVLKRKT